MDTKFVRRCITLLFAICLMGGCGNMVSVGSAYANMQTLPPERAETRTISDPLSYISLNGNEYRIFTPGIIRPEEGTIELTVSIDQDYSGSINDWLFLFRSTPSQPGLGNNWFGAYMQPPLERPTNDDYEDILRFFIKNGQDTTQGIYAKILPEQLNYTPMEAFNLAFVWKMGKGGYAAVYKNGVEISRSPGNASRVLEQFMGTQMFFSRMAPFAISNLKISTSALSADELESKPIAFTRGEHTALLADITYGQDVKQAFFTTPYHTESAYCGAKPIFAVGKSTYFVGETPYYPVLLINHGNTEAAYTVSLQGEDQYENNQFSREETLSVPPDGEYHITEIPIPAFMAGYYTLATSIRSASQETTYHSAITITPQPDDLADGSLADNYGQHIGVEYDMEAFEKMNVSITRGWEAARVFMWYAVEPANDQFNWNAADEYVQRATENNLDVYAVLGYPADWASARPPAQENTTPPMESAYEYLSGRYVSKDIKADTNGLLGDGELWRDYVYQVMKRYAGQVKYFEIVNEVNFHKGFLPASFNGTKEEYFLMQKIAYEQAQRVKAEYRDQTGTELALYVSSSGFSPIGGKDVDRQMVLEALDKEQAQYYDIFSIHGYSGTNGIADVLAAFKKAKQQNPNLQLWQGEYATASLPNDSMSWRVFATVENYMSFLAAGADKYISMGVPDGDEYVTRATQSPTPIFQTMAVMQQNLRKADQYVGRYKGFSGEDLLPVRDYCKRTDGSYLSIFSAEKSCNLTFRNPHKILYAMDSYGVFVTVEQGVLTKNNSLFVVSSAPLKIKKASE